MARNVVRPRSFSYAGSLELACHVVLGDVDLSWGVGGGGGVGGDGCQKLSYVKSLLSK